MCFSVTDYQPILLRKDTGSCESVCNVIFFLDICTISLKAVYTCALYVLHSVKVFAAPILIFWDHMYCCGLVPHDYKSSTVCLFVGCLTSRQRACVFQGQICSDNFTCCHTEIEVADQTFYLTQSQYTDTGPTSPSTDPLTPGAWQGSHCCANFWVAVMTRPRKQSHRKWDSNLGSSALKADALATRPSRRLYSTAWYYIYVVLTLYGVCPWLKVAGTQFQLWYKLSYCLTQELLSLPSVWNNPIEMIWTVFH